MAKQFLVTKTMKDGSKEGVMFSDHSDAKDALSGDCETGSSLAIAWCELYGGDEGIELTEIELSAPDERFSKSFMEAVEEFYEEWKVDNGARLPDFEKALERAKTEGVAPQL